MHYTYCEVIAADLRGIFLNHIRPCPHVRAPPGCSSKAKLAPLGSARELAILPWNCAMPALVSFLLILGKDNKTNSKLGIF